MKMMFFLLVTIAINAQARITSIAELPAELASDKDCNSLQTAFSGRLFWRRSVPIWVGFNSRKSGRCVTADASDRYLTCEFGYRDSDCLVQYDVDFETSRDGWIRKVIHRSQKDEHGHCQIEFDSIDLRDLEDAYCSFLPNLRRG